MSDSKPLIAAIIPALNERESIVHVVRSLVDRGIRYVRVVDNGSSDETASLASGAGADVFFEAKRGYGAACWRGLQDLPGEVDWILFCDADGSDDLDRLPDFIRHAATYDFILGARQNDAGSGGMSKAQGIGNAIATTCMAWGWKRRFLDMGPFRLIRRSALESLAMEDRTWGWTLEMQVKAVEHGLGIIEIPVRSLPRRGGQSKIGGSWIGGMRASARILVTILKLYRRRP